MSFTLLSSGRDPTTGVHAKGLKDGECQTKTIGPKLKLFTKFHNIFLLALMGEKNKKKCTFLLDLVSKKSLNMKLYFAFLL